MTSTYPRCPSCGALSWPPHLTIHRPGCPHTHTDPATWPDEEQSP